MVDSKNQAANKPTTNYQLPTTPPLIGVVGETASGKSALGMELARQFNGEIICADSRTVYKGMDIGTAKPSVQDQTEIPHHLLDVVEPDEPFTVADFKRLATKAIEDIGHGGKLPIMVGGSGLYVDSVLYDYQFSQADAERDPDNPRHLKKVEEPVVHQLRPNTLVLGLQLEREVLERRIAERVETMVEAGFIDEVRRLMDRFEVDSKAFLAPGYKAFAAYVRGELDLEQAKQQFIRGDVQLAKRQRTWFKRNKSIHWIQDSAQAKKLVQNFLSKAL
jgi:tRNA dimethylallyltransferase